MSLLRIAGPGRRTRQALIREEQAEALRARQTMADREPELAAEQTNRELARADAARAVAHSRERVRLAELDAEREERAERRWRDLLHKVERALERGEITVAQAAKLLGRREQGDLAEAVASLLRPVGGDAA